MIYDIATNRFIEKTARAWVKTGKTQTDFLYIWYRIYERIRALRSVAP